jgi:hypothetical protein
VFTGVQGKFQKMKNILYDNGRTIWKLASFMPEYEDIFPKRFCTYFSTEVLNSGPHAC